MPIEEYLATRKRNKKILNTIELSHNIAFYQCLEVLVGEDGLLDIELLKKEEYQEKFADSLWDFYTEASTQFFESQTEDSLRKAMMTSVYAGFDKKSLLQLIKQENTSLFSENKYTNAIPQFTEQIKNLILGENSSHISEEDIDPIIDYTGVRDIVDREKVDRVGAVRILNTYAEHGTVPPNWIKDYLKEESREED